MCGLFAGDCSGSGWTGNGGNCDPVAGSGCIFDPRTPWYQNRNGGQSGFSFGFDVAPGFGFGGDGSGGVWNEMQLPMPGSLGDVYQSVWSDVLGLPSGLNCPVQGGVFSPLCGGVSPTMDVGPPLPCLTSAIENATQAGQVFDAGREVRLLRATATGATFGAISGFRAGKIALLIPFVGPYVATGTGVSGAVIGGLAGGGASFLKAAAIDQLRRDFLTSDTFMGSWTKCESVSSAPGGSGRPF